MPRADVLISLGASLAVHTAALAWLGFSGRGPISAEASTGRSSETVLTFNEPAPAPAIEEAPAETVKEEAPPPVVEEELTIEPAPVADRPPPLPAPPPPPPKITPAPWAKPSPPPSPPVEAATPAKNTVFAGVQARRAHRVVYVVDASGPMASSLAFVKGELARSIGALEADQSFQVLFFREVTSGGGTSYVAFDSGGSSPQLIPATADVKRRFQAWLGTIRPAGRSNPEPALEESLRLGPDLVFVLSRRIKRTNLADAAGETRQILASLDRLNPPDRLTGHRLVVIKTIQFLDDDPSGLLQAIGQTHGDGPDSYKLLTIGELSGGR